MGLFGPGSGTQALTTGKAWLLRCPCLLVQDHEVVPFQMATNQNQDKGTAPMSHLRVLLPLRQTSGLPRQYYHLENRWKAHPPEGNVSNLKHNKGQVRSSTSKLSADIQFAMLDWQGSQLTIDPRYGLFSMRFHGECSAEGFHSWADQPGELGPWDCISILLYYRKGSKWYFKITVPILWVSYRPFELFG